MLSEKSREKRCIYRLIQRRTIQQMFPRENNWLWPPTAGCLWGIAGSDREKTGREIRRHRRIHRGGRRDIRDVVTIRLIEAIIGAEWNLATRSVMAALTKLHDGRSVTLSARLRCRGSYRTSHRIWRYEADQRGRWNMAGRMGDPIIYLYLLLNRTRSTDMHSGYIHTSFARK